MAKIDATTGLQFEVKQPSESRLYTIDFTNLLASGEGLNAILGTTITRQEKVAQVNILTYVSPNIVVTTVTMRFENGDDGEDYKVTIKVNTDQSNTIEGDILIRVTDL